MDEQSNDEIARIDLTAFEHDIIIREIIVMLNEIDSPTVRDSFSTMLLALGVPTEL